MKRNRVTVQGATIPRMDRQDIWVGGYHAAMASAFAADVEISDENTPVYGYDATIDTRILNAGTLSLTSYEHPDKTAEIIDLLSGVDPMFKGLRGYKPVGSFVTDVVRAQKHPTHDYYIACEFFAAWNTVLRPKQGDPKSSGVRNFEGRCALPLEFRVKDPENEYAAVVFDVAAMTLDGTGDFTVGTLASQTAIAANPTYDALGTLSGKVGLAVEIQKRTSPDGTNPNGKITKAARLNIVTGLVTTGGLVTVYKKDIAGTNFETLADITHVHVYALKTGTPSGSTQLLGDGLDVRGRHDLPT